MQPVRGSPQPGQDVTQVLGPEHLDAVDDGGLLQRADRDDRTAHARAPRGEQAGQHAPDGADPPVERELPEQDGVVQRARGHRAGRCEHHAREGHVKP